MSKVAFEAGLNKLGSQAGGQTWHMHMYTGNDTPTVATTSEQKHA